MNDSKFEGENHVCKVKCAPFKMLKDMGGDVFKETDLDKLAQDVSSYNKFNEEVAVRYTKSFSNYLDAKIFSYENGIITLKASNERFFLMEVSGIYLLELELKKRKMDGNIFNIAYKIGKDLFGEFSSDTHALVELITALGWGEIIILPEAKGGIQVVINHFPWTNWYKDIDFVVIRGFLSGIFSKTYKREIKLNKPEIDLKNNHLALLFKEK